MVWKEAVPFRVYNMFEPGRIIPALAHACRESRQTFLGFCTIPDNPLRDPESQLQAVDYRSWMFVTPSKSVAYFKILDEYINDWMDLCEHVELIEFPELILQLPTTMHRMVNLEPKSVAYSDVNCQESDNEWVRLLLDEDEFSESEYEDERSVYHSPFGNVDALRPQFVANKILSLAPGQPCYIAHDFGRQDLLRDLFLGDRTIVVDLEDRKQVGRVAHILRRLRQHTGGQFIGTQVSNPRELE